MFQRLTDSATTRAHTGADIRRALRIVALTATTLAMHASAHAQAAAPTVTIGDYSDAQRAAIDADIKRALAKAQSGSDIQVPAPTAGIAAAIPLAGGANGVPVAASRPAAPPEPRVFVSGVAQLHGRWLAEVITDSGTQLLQPGQSVPGTLWRVEAIGATGVVLTKSAGKSSRLITRSFPVSGQAG